VLEETARHGTNREGLPGREGTAGQRVLRRADLRGKENFHITGIPMSAEPYFVKAFGYVKKAAALANRDLGVLDAGWPTRSSAPVTG
jgi:hypothetical protein